MKRNQHLLCLFLVTLILIFFLSMVFLSIQHKCHHNECPICLFIASVKRLLGALCILLIAQIWHTLPSLGEHVFYDKTNGSEQPSTPVTLKVKLSN